MTPTAILFPGEGGQTARMRELVEFARPDLVRQVTPLVGEDPFARGDGLRLVVLRGLLVSIAEDDMQAAVIPFREALAEIEFRTPDVAVFSCATALPFVDPREELAAALVRPVRWRETMLALSGDGVQSFVAVHLCDHATNLEEAA